jgi:hypothetical protein
MSAAIAGRRRTAGTVESFILSLFYFIQPQSFVPKELVRYKGALTLTLFQLQTESVLMQHFGWIDQRTL